MNKLLMFLIVCFVHVHARGDAVWAQSPMVDDLQPTGKFEIQEDLTDDDGAIATDVSGIACMPPGGPKRTCLVIDDQGRFAQFVSIEGNLLTGGAKLPLIGKKPSSSTIGREPREERTATAVRPRA